VDELCENVWAAIRHGRRKTGRSNLGVIKKVDKGISAPQKVGVR